MLNINRYCWKLRTLNFFEDFKIWTISSAKMIHHTISNFFNIFNSVVGFIIIDGNEKLYDDTKMWTGKMFNNRTSSVYTKV